MAVKVVALYRDNITDELMLHRREAHEDVGDHPLTIEAEWDVVRQLPNHENIVTFHNVLWWRPEVDQSALPASPRCLRNSSPLPDRIPCR